MSGEFSGLRVAWLIPEFPRQSHTFFHRELMALSRLGVDVRVYSTRRPLRPAVHKWAAQSLADTKYLHPPGLRDVAVALRTLLLAGPAAWTRVARALYAADVPTLKDRARLVGLVFYGAELAGLMKQDGRRHVHVQFCSDTAHVGLFAKLIAGTTYSISHHEHLAEFGPNQLQKWQHASFGHTISTVHLDELRRELGSAAPADIAVAPMGIEPDSFKRQRPYQAWSGNGNFRLFSCARLTPGKNQEALLRAIARLNEAGIPASLRMAGTDETPEGSYYRRLTETIAELGLGARVTMLGQVSEDQVRDELEQAHAFALPSLHEGVPVAVMEAMAMNVPVVVTDVGGVRDLVEDRVEGVIVEPGNVAAMFEGLQWLARNPANADSISSNARQKVALRFHSGVSAESLASAMARHLPAGSLAGRQPAAAAR